MEWKEYNICQLCDTISETYKGKSNSVVLINTSDVLEGKVLNHKRVPNKGLKGQFKKSFKKNDILYSEIRPANKRFAYINFSPNDYIASTKLMVLRSKPIVSSHFLFQILKSEIVLKNLQMLAESRSGTFPQITYSELSNVRVKVPPLPVQDKIVGILSALDSKIENNNKINANLEAQAEALFKSWFVDFTPFKDQPFVDSELGPIPQGWKVGKLGDYCEVKSGYAFKSSWWTNKGYKIIKIKNISENGDINLNDCSCVLPENCDKAKNFIANTGDIVIAMTGATIGKFNIIPKIDEKFYINQRVGKFFLGEKPIEKVPYIYCFLKQENISTQIIQKGQGSAQPNISGADIESIPMLTPMSIILKYNKMCQPLFEKILSNRLESKKLSALRDTLLPKLMSGEIKL